MACFTKTVNIFVCYFLSPDAPMFVSNQTMYYSWEGNPINISCEVLANPSASVQWRRGKLVLPVKNTTHLKTYSTGRKLILEVRLKIENNVVTLISSSAWYHCKYYRMHLRIRLTIS